MRALTGFITTQPGLRMRKCLYYIPFLLLIISCQKEPNVTDLPPNTPGGGTVEQGPLLIRSVESADGDSSVTTYDYDANKKLIYHSGDYLFTSGVAARITRTSQGIIRYFSFIDSGDSVSYNVNYDATAARYSSRTGSMDFNGMSIKDSSVFIYDQDKIVREEVYYVYSGFAINQGHYDYTYDAGKNLLKLQLYSRDSLNGPLVLMEEVLLDHDSKVSPINMGAEGIVTGLIQFASPANITKLTDNYPNDPSNNDVISIGYQYNTANRPLTSKASLQSTGDTLHTNYFYR